MRRVLAGVDGISYHTAPPQTHQIAACGTTAFFLIRPDISCPICWLTRSCTGPMDTANRLPFTSKFYPKWICVFRYTTANRKENTKCICYTFGVCRESPVALRAAHRPCKWMKTINFAATASQAKQIRVLSVNIQGFCYGHTYNDSVRHRWIV